MDDKERARHIIQQLQAGSVGNKPEPYEPQPGQIDNQQADGVETIEVPGIGVVFKDAGLSTNTNKPTVQENTQNVQAPESVYPSGASQCPQCGKYHPPLKQGETCPMAPVKVITASGEEKIIDVNMFLDKMRVIFLSQLEQKSIVDPDEFMKYLIVETTKIIEEYEGTKNAKDK